MVIYYDNNALQKAGIDDQTAFLTDIMLVDTLNKLQQAGYKYPLALTTTGVNPVIVHEAAHWLWNAGGDFISRDAQQITFTQPAAMRGWRNYFSLKPYISPDLLGLTYVSDLTRSPIHLGGPGLVIQREDQHHELDPVLAKGMKITPAPGVAFIGGTHLIIWNYSPRVEESFELVRFLVSQSIHIPASPHGRELPVRSEALNQPLILEDNSHRILLQALQAGRTFPTIRLWGSIEDKLTVCIRNIWADLFANANQDLDVCLHKHLDPLADRLNTVLKA